VGAAGTLDAPALFLFFAYVLLVFSVLGATYTTAVLRATSATPVFLR
jgi:hypothetical protein